MRIYAHNEYYRIPESEILPKLILATRLNKSDRDTIISSAKHIQENLNETHYVHKIMKAYNLSSAEGMALMTLCEALLRTPDQKTKDELIKEKLSKAQWDLIAENSFYATISGIALTKAQSFALYDTVVKRMGWPAVRMMVEEVVKVMGKLYVMGETIQHAIKKKQTTYSYSFDMLGEAALTWDDANSYYEKYIDAAMLFKDSISVKLSAIHPRYELRNYHDVINHLVPKLAAIARVCEEHGTTMFIDAEESYRLDLSVMVLEALLKTHRFKKNTIGFAVQAYQKRAFWLLDTLESIASEAATRIVVRLVKGAYWDTEIKLAQQEGLHYPVFTRKEFTDISYLACARKLMQSKFIIPAYATHNPFTVAAIYHYNTELGGDFEFQKLYGMGNGLFDQIKKEYDTNIRIYAPVGEYKDLLAYLVRRLLENGANTSFVFNQQVVDPFVEAKQVKDNLPSYLDLYGKRKNSNGYDLTDIENIMSLPNISTSFSDNFYNYDLDQSLSVLSSPDNTWKNMSFSDRKKVILQYADYLEEHIVTAAKTISDHAYKTYPNAIAEVREGIDFIRYYAELAEDMYENKEFSILQGYTGEFNKISYEPRGTWMVIAPWNFPFAIFIGPIIAALLTGNTVLAKSAPQTEVIAQVTLECMAVSGIPEDAVRLCDPDILVAKSALADERINGVTFTGSHATAKSIQRTLAERDGAIIPFIAETGGINCMIADSTCLPEQLIKDVILGAFDSAGQRCSATRFLFVQKENSETILTMLKGAMKNIVLGFPADLNTDVSRVIDGAAYARIQERIATLEENEVLISTKGRNGAELPKLTVAPSAYLVSDYRKYFDKEIFGPLLHVYVYDKDELDEIVDYINSKQYGLTLGIHSRISTLYEELSTKLKVGNIYINRDQIGAVVETHPFGGVGLSGTGPKAGGPDYLRSYVWEKHICINTTAIGGNTVLLSSK
jgi:RHH-type proline utilization regulon transcriptional repressor/proline dehydrogenase/delta 1-pyrroline-5-carboxylate dehydrogenase